MTTYQFGDVVLVDFPFSDRNAEKRRPGFVLAQDPHGDLLVARISSKSAEFSTDVSLIDWKTAGLNIPSTARLLKLATTHQSNVLRVLGTTSVADRQIVISAFRAFLINLESTI
jgi:mRNA interferase MazF